MWWDPADRKAAANPDQPPDEAWLAYDPDGYNADSLSASAWLALLLVCVAAVIPLVLIAMLAGPMLEEATR